MQRQFKYLALLFLKKRYDYQAVMAWLAERADRILVLFDAHKLDISDEFSQILNIIKPHSEKASS